MYISNDVSSCVADCAPTHANGLTYAGEKLCVSKIENCSEHGKIGICLKCETTHYLSTSSYLCLDNCNDNTSATAFAIDADGHKFCVPEITDCTTYSYVDGVSACTECSND